MLPVSQAELQAIQNEAASAVCDKTCQIYAHVKATDEWGSNIDTWPTLTATTTCGMSQPSALHLQNYDFLVGSEATWLVHFPIGTTVNHLDHLIIENQTLEVHVILTPESYPALLQVLAAEIK